MASNVIAPRISSYALGRPLSQSHSHAAILPFLLPFASVRHASGLSLVNKTGKPKAGSKKKADVVKPTKKKKAAFNRENMKGALQFSLCDAMRYIRAFEVGQKASSVKYELAISMRSLKNGPVVRNRMRLPHAVDTSSRIAVICKPDSPAAVAAVKAGASLVGEDTLIDAIKEGRIEFEKLLCHTDSVDKLQKANLGRILGPKGLMPSPKTSTVVSNVATAVKGMVGGTEYREKIGVVRLAIGQLGFTPEQMQANIKAFMTNLKADVAQISEQMTKEIHEVVLSSTHGPGLPLSGEFVSKESIPTKALGVL